MENNFMGNSWAVVGFDYDTAKAIITAIEHSAVDKDILKRMQTKYELLTEFTDGTTLRWIDVSHFSKGFRSNKMWVDKNIDENIFRCVILPMYCGKIEDINWI